MNEDKLQQLLETQNKILAVVLDVQAKQTASDRCIIKLEDSVNKLVNRLDDLIVLLNRHEAEIAAMRDNYRRLEERIGLLESKFSS